MKLSQNWLKQFVKINILPEQLAEKLTLAGFEVEKINYGPGIKRVKVGEIVSIRKHPKAKKLKLLKVKISKNKILNIVCGALNIARGQKVPVALAGAELVGLDIDGKPGKEPLVIQETEIRGIKSQGLLCAEDELGISNDHSGIYILDPETKIGEDINRVLDLDDVVFDLEVTPNRGDCLSVWGLAREAATITGKSLMNKTRPSFSRGEERQGLCPKIEVREPKLCPKYTARIIKNIEVGSSPEWLKARLRVMGIRSVNNIVDITNYVMMELGQPLHAFDLISLPADKDGLRQIIVRKARSKEKIVTIDGKKRELDEEMLVIADETKPIAAAGIMGGKDSEITEKTSDIILESAQFDPVSIRRTARKLGLQSDSSYRFERGVDWNMVEVALDRATEMIMQNAKTKKKKIEIGKIVRKSQQERYLRRVIKIPVGRVSEILGVKISKKKIEDILIALGFKVAYFEAKKLKSYEAEKLTEEARKLLGRPYKYGAKESEAPKKFDCSSFVQYLYKKIGIIIPRCSIDQAECGEEVQSTNYELRITKKGAPDEAKQSLTKKLQRLFKPGDLIFSKSDDKESSPHYSANFPHGLGHVGIYVGGGRVIHASKERGVIVEDDLGKYIKDKRRCGVRRIFGSIRETLFQNGGLIVIIPSWREDISIPEDLVEEVGRIYDYNKLRPTALRGKTPFPKINRELVWENLIRDTLVAIGMTEVYNYSFYGRTQMDTDENTNLDGKHLRVINPINPDQEFLRISLIPQILTIAEKNAKNFDEVKVFEMGNVYSQKLSGVDERKMVAGVILNQKPKNNPQKYSEEMFFKIKGIVELLLEKLGIEKEKINYQLPEGIEKNFRLPVACYVLHEKKVLGLIGGKNLNIGFFELDFQALIKRAKEKKEFQPISYYPVVERDLAIVVDKNISYSNLNEAIKKIDPLIRAIELFDIFESEEKIGKNKKSLAFHLKFQASDRTLKKTEVDEIFQKILEKLKENFRAKIRE